MVAILLVTLGVDEDARKVMQLEAFWEICAANKLPSFLSNEHNYESRHVAWVSQGAMKGDFEYRCEAATLDGFIQQLAASYLRHGYFFFVTGTIREGKDPREIDRRIIERYGLAISKFTRARRKKSGAASVQYLRHERFFVLLATHGKHRFFEEEVEIKDARETPIRYEGYSVSVRAGRSCVRIDRGTYLNLKAYFEEIAAKRSVEILSKQLRGLPFSPYAPVRSQVFAILRSVNRARQVAGFDPVPRSAVKVRRAPVKTFALSQSTL